MFEKIIKDRPASTTKEEIRGKLSRLKEYVDSTQFSRVLITQEGAIRWLTGKAQQVIDIAPDSDSPIWIEVACSGDRCKLLLIGDHYEMNRLRGESAAIYGAIERVDVDFQEKTEYRADTNTTLLPSHSSYDTFLNCIVRPLLRGLTGNQYKKLSWLSAATYWALCTVVADLTPEINGLKLKGKIAGLLNELGIEENLVLIGLKGQEGHLHPLSRWEYTVPRRGLIKIAVGARYSDMIYSGTLTAYIGERIPRDIQNNYDALRKGALEYADLYRSGAYENEIYKRVSDIFRQIENDTGIPNFRKSAYLHHLGGPMSSLGNRDFLISRNGNRVVTPWNQFAVNPVDALTYTKVEIQGIVQTQGSPHILDVSRYCTDSTFSFTEYTSISRMTAKLPDIILQQP